MANQVGRVRFANGTTLYPVVQGTSGGVSTRLYQSADEAHQRRDDFDQKYPKVPEAVPDGELVEVWEWNGDEGQPDFKSRASKSLMLLTGPASRDEVTGEYTKWLAEQSGFGCGSQ